MGGFGSRPMRTAWFAAALLAFSAAGVVAPTLAHADSTVSSCDDATLRAASGAGGVVTFTVNCPSILLSGPFDIPAGLNVDIRADGHRSPAPFHKTTKSHRAGKPPPPFQKENR